MSTTNTKDLIKENVRFTQHHLPGLDAGSYQLTVEQSVSDSDGIAVSGASYSDTKHFAVKGDRFVISQPSQTIHSVFPSDKASGEFSTVLPHVLFSKKTFPWIRVPTTGTNPYKSSEAGKDTDEDVPTWLWVMLLDEDDVQENPTLALTPKTGTIADLYPSGSNKCYSYFQGIAPPVGLDVGESITDKIQYIDIPQQLFWQIAPSIDDLKLMAHGRTVAIDSSDKDAKSIKDPDLGSYSLVCGNRLPGTGNKTDAYLVSLEGLQDYLPQTGGTPPSSSSKLTAGVPFRLVVLKSWSFFSTGESAKFVHKLEKLNSGSTLPDHEGTNTNLILPYSGINKVVKDAVSMGYTPMNETLRTGEETVSWYRGPLAPYNVESKDFNLPFSSSDSALIYDPTTGLFDVSYASAWTLGRLISLQDKSFSVDLYNWKKGQTQEIINQIEQQLIESLTNNLSGIRSTDSAEPLKIKDRLIKSIVNLLAD